MLFRSGSINDLYARREQLARYAGAAPSAETRESALAMMKELDEQIKHKESLLESLPKEEYSKYNVDPTYAGPVMINRSTNKIEFPGKPAQVTNIDMKGETKEAEELGKLNAKRQDEMRTAGDKSLDQINKLNLLERLFDTTKTGAFADAQADIVRYG